MARTSPCRRGWRRPSSCIALTDALRGYPGTTLEFITTGCINGFTEDEIEIMIELSARADRPLNWNVLSIDPSRPQQHEHQLSASDRAARRGARIVALAMPTDRPVAHLLPRLLRAVFVAEMEGHLPAAHRPADALLRRPGRAARAQRHRDRAPTPARCGASRAGPTSRSARPSRPRMPGWRDDWCATSRPNGVEIRGMSCAISPSAIGCAPCSGQQDAWRRRRPASARRHCAIHEC